MGQNNPLRGQYMLVGGDLIRAGIRNVAADPALSIPAHTGFYGEFAGNLLSSDAPAQERWLTSRAVSSAASKAGVPVDLASVPLKVIHKFLKDDPKAAFRLTEDAILHLLPGGATPENKQYAADQIAKLEATYMVVAPAAASSAA
jgi:hypothetical protein